MKAAGKNPHGDRDATMILLAFRHGLRASELCSLRWEQVDLVHGRLHVSRLKSGIPSVHPLTGPSARARARLLPVLERAGRTHECRRLPQNDYEARQSLGLGTSVSVNGTAIVLAYVLVSMGVIIAFLLAVFVIGWFIGRLRERRRGRRGEE
jgi:hypothetical protein